MTKPVSIPSFLVVTHARSRARFESDLNSFIIKVPICVDSFKNLVPIAKGKEQVPQGHPFTVDHQEPEDKRPTTVKWFQKGD